jgi:phage FluMu gp28-like protein
MDAEWAEDEDTWLAQSLIVSCVGTVKNCGEDLQEFSPEANYQGDFFAGLDLAQTRDYCVLSVVERLNDKLFLRHLKIFQQPTLYASLSNSVKTIKFLLKLAIRR